MGGAHYQIAKGWNSALSKVLDENHKYLVQLVGKPEGEDRHVHDYMLYKEMNEDEIIKDALARSKEVNVTLTNINIFSLEAKLVTKKNVF